jgi:GDP/UDP-N,N'-diacetylbacillosamine 2-epimerase (hydrolysing)
VAVIGNSSSGIIEVPSLHVPTVNIGDRQKGRLMSDSVINCISTVEDIRNALRQVLSSESREKIKMSANPYEGGDVSSRIVLVLKEFLSSDDIILKKVFYNIM